MAESSAPKLKLKLICYIDDSKTSAFVTKKMLQQAGYQVDHFPDAESAIEAILERDYSFVVTDLMISADGGVNGDDLINIIRRSGHPIKSLLPIVVVTSASDKTVHQSLLDAGANAVLVKPLDANQFEKTIKNLPASQTPIKKPKDTKQVSAEKSEVVITPSNKTVEKSQRFLAEELENLPHFEIKPTHDKVPTLNEEFVPNKKKEEKPSITRESFFFEDLKNTTPDIVVKKDIKPKRAMVDIPLLDIDTTPIATPEPEEQVQLEPEPARPVEPSATPKPRVEQSEKIDKVSPKVTSASTKTPPEINAGAGSSLNFDDIIKLYDMDENEGEAETLPKQEKSVQSEPTPVEIRAKKIAPEVVEETATPAEKPARAPSNDPLQAFLENLENEPELEQTQSKSAIKLPKFTLTPTVARYGLIALAMVFTLPALFAWLFSEKSVSVDTYAVIQGPIFETISVPGKVVSNKQINVTSFFPGQVTQVMVKEGETVTKGQVLVKLDDRELRTKVNRAEAHLISMKESVAASAKTLERLQKALNLGAVSRQMVEDAEASWKSQSAKQSLAEEELKEAKLSLERTEIKASFDGVVSTLYAQSGQMVSPPDPMLKLVDVGNTEIELKVDAADSSVLREGQVVSLRTDAFPGKSWNETVSRISTTANRDTTTNMIAVATTLGKDAPPLKVGQQVDAEIRTAANNRALLIPFEAVRTVNGQTMVAVEVNSRVHYVPIQTGIESLTNVEVVQGLSLGQKILLPGGLVLEEGQKISFRQP